MDTNKKKSQGKPKKHFVMTSGRKLALAKAQKIHVILINIGKKYRNKEAHKFKLLGK